MLPLVIILMLPAFIVSGDIKELNPVLKSGWLGVHTSFAVLGDAAFAFAFIVSVMYLIQEHQLKAKHLGAFFTVCRRWTSWTLSGTGHSPSAGPCSRSA